MQHVKDDMDDLFRRAADNYPLKTDNANWDLIAKKISGIKTVRTNSTNNKHYRYLLWLLLLLPLGYGLYKNSFLEENVKPGETVPKNIVDKHSPVTPTPNNTVTVSTPVKKVDVTTNNTTPQVKNSSIIHRNEKGKLTAFISQNNSVTLLPDPSSSNNTKQANDPVTKENKVIPALTNKDIVEGKNETTAKPGDPVTESGVNNREEKTKKEKNKISKERGLYAGIIISPDISTVKFQPVKNIGISMGILAGYQLNNRLSIESGVSWSIKNYYSKGDYFKTNNIYMPTGSKIITVDGECYMIEVPVAVKYNFRATGKKNLSASAGVSSYFMKKESYDYDISRNGQQYPYSSTYKKKSTYLFAVATFAVGYNRQIKKGVKLRIEPYLKIPVKNVGIGSLPIMSSGLNIGITKKLLQ